jgi:hypothetical protein
VHFTRTRRSFFVFWLTFGLVSLLAFATKTHIALFIPAIVAALWIVNQGHRTSNSIPRLVGATVGLVLIGIGTLWLALTGGYTSGTQDVRDLSFIFDRRFLLLVAVAVAYGAYLVYRAIMQEFHPIELVPLLILIPFTASFSVWTVRNYYLAVASIGVATMAAVIVANFKSKYVGPVAAILCLAAALVWIAWRVPLIYQPLASLQDFLVSTEAQFLAQQKKVVGVQCWESGLDFHRYAESEGVPDLQFKWTAGRPEDFEFVLGDDRLCPFNPDPMATRWNLEWEGPRHGGYALYHNRSFMN